MTENEIKNFCYGDRHPQVYRRDGLYERFYAHPGCSCSNPVVLGYFRYGEDDWKENWLEACKNEDGMWVYGYNITKPVWDCPNAASFGGHWASFWRNRYTQKFFSCEEAIMAAIRFVFERLRKDGDNQHEATYEMLKRAQDELSDLKLFD